MDRTYIVYLLTNTINGKIYVGKTKRRLCSRMADHRYFAKRGCKFPISRAISKYGWESFTVRVIKECKTEIEMSNVETETIHSLNAADRTIGYNVCSEQQDHRFSNSTDWRRGQRRLSQGRRGNGMSKYSKFVGARWWGNRWYCQCTIGGKNVSKVCSDEISAAVLYDKICLYHYGPNCNLNFSDRRSEYLKEDLRTVFDEFMNASHSSTVKNVFYDKSRNRWGFAKTVNGKKIFKRFKTEAAAISYQTNFNTNE